ncbi:MAG: NAD-glutamate dehydrogenase domain-containing protein, partial [Leptospirales bacterium]
AEYRARNTISSAVRDIQTLLQIQEHGEIIRGNYNKEKKNSSLTLYLKKSQTLSYMVPVLSNLGLDVLDEELYTFNYKDEDIHVYKFHVTYNKQPIQDTELLKRLCDAFQYILAQKASSEPLNKLIAGSGLNIHQIELLKALIAYLVQVRKGYSRVLVKNILERNPNIALAIIFSAEDRFLTILKPRLSNTKIHESVKKHVPALPLVESEIDNYLEKKKAEIEQVLPATLVQKELLDSLKSIILAISRTTYFTTADTISFKIRPGDIPFVLEPRPYVETWVYHSFFEGIHLRGGPLARGGLRWSNRQDDFRSEVWGLWKTQVIKNTIIVPTGAKGGFVLKYLPNIPENGIWAYKLFINSLLEITDNRDSSLIKEDIAIPVDDDHDPYLVVAADKGTATFSDYANDISISKNFWLSDAFASGGQNGYSHKELGITAKGAWESVRWHFYTENLNPAKDEFTAVGIGDMAGDVFGNGMLLSKKIKLIGAFNHRHIFLDPDPDCEKSFQERKRLFETNGQWSDYNKKVISSGGGVYAREAISISLSTAMRKSLGTEKQAVTGVELIRLLLVAPVKMLFNGGIGTYVKSSLESNQDIDDIVNDNVRVDAVDLKARMVIEGGNLGLSARGRFQFSRLGGLINTDAIDNSAGVDLSDHEVNLKILLEDLVRKKEVKKEDRNSLLKKVSDEAASLVLSNNFRQNWSLAYQSNLPEAEHRYFIDMVEYLIQAKHVRENSENIPRIAVIRDALQTKGKVPRSLISILLGYTKIFLASEYTEIPERYYEATLLQYFPSSLHKYEKAIFRHPLKQEIVKLLLINEVADNAGMAYFIKTKNLLSMDVNDSINSYLFARNILDVDHQQVWAYLPDMKARSFPDKVSFEIASKLKGLIENTVYRFIEMVKLFPQKGPHGFPKEIKKLHVYTFSKKTEGQIPEWAKAFPENLSKRISHWMYIELEYIFNYLSVKLTPARKEQIFLHYLEHGAFLKEVLYNSVSQNRWETQAIMNLKRQFWGWVINEMPAVSGKDKKIDLNYEIRSLQEKKDLNISSLSGLIGFLANGKK